MNSDDIRDLLETIAKGIVDNKDVVRVEAKQDEMGMLYDIDVAPEERGKIIGRKGETITALRTVTRAIGMANGVRVSVKVVDDRR